MSIYKHRRIAAPRPAVDSEEAKAVREARELRKQRLAGAIDACRLAGGASAAAMPPPLSNRGVPAHGDVPPRRVEAAEMENYLYFYADAKGRMVEVPLRRGKGDSAFIDAVSFTFHESSLGQFVADEEYMEQASFRLWQIFGFGIHKQAKGHGNRFYDRCYIMGDEDTMYGRVHHGGQNETILVEILGTGCLAAKSGWEERLYDFLTAECIRPKLRRVDVAKDFFAGEYSPDQAYADWEAGLFDKRGKRPIAERIGADWTSPTSRGKTFAVGSRQSSCYARIYDKAKQLGDAHGTFCRFELEFKGKYCLVPFEILLVPGEFFGGSSAAAARFAETENKRYTGAKKLVQTTIERVQEVARKQCGRAINLMLELGNTAEQIVQKLKADAGLLPQRLKPESFCCEFYPNTPFHKLPRKMDVLGMVQTDYCFT